MHIIQIGHNIKVVMYPMSKNMIVKVSSGLFISNYLQLKYFKRLTIKTSFISFYFRIN